jgi:acetyl esterase/lipase
VNDSTNRRVHRRRAAWLLVSVVAGAAAFSPSSGATPVRYRDRVFTSVSVTKGIVYGAARTNRGVLQSLLLDLYEPAGDTYGARAAIVFAHGGAFARGSRSDPDVVKAVVEYAKHGFVVASIDYRVRSGGPGYETVPELVVDSYTTGSPTIRDAQHDMQAAVRFLRKWSAQYRIDKIRIAAAGQSAGAVMALAVNYRPNDPGSSGNPGVPSDVAGAVSISGAEVPRAIGPLESPVVMFHGTNDTTVPFPLAVISCSTALALANICEFHAYPLAEHSLGGYGTEIMTRSCDFLWRQVIHGPKRGRLRK